jgi:hypothetical protein
MTINWKVILGITAAVLIAAAIYTNVRVLNKLRATESNYTIETALHEKADSLNAVYLTKIAENDTTIAKLNKEYLFSRHEVSKLDSILKSKIDVIDIEVPFDSSYAYLCRKYPAIAEKIYNFDGLQVKQFHKLDVNLLYSGLKIEGLNNSLGLCDSLGRIKDLQIRDYKDLYANSVIDKNLYKLESLRLQGVNDRTQDKLDKVKLTRNITIGGLSLFIIYEVVKLIR